MQDSDWGNSNFENDPRQKLNRAMMPFIDDVYYSVFGRAIQIKRIEQPDDYILDRKFAIDTIITLPTGCILTGQEKCLDTTFGTLTVEYMQNPLTNEKGDWFNLAAQFYFCGYATKRRDSFSMWVIVNWASLVLSAFNHSFKWLENKNKDGKARASFKYIKFTDIPGNCLIASKITPRRA